MQGRVPGGAAVAVRRTWPVTTLVAVLCAVVAASAVKRWALIGPVHRLPKLADPVRPAMNGIEATRRLRADHPDVEVVMLTMLEDDDSLFAAMCAGAHGCILKGADTADVLATVRAHISNVFVELHVADRAQAIVAARDAGLGRSTSHR